MAFYFCSGSAKKLEKVLIGDITKNSTIKMADKGYKASEYVKWTTDNFCFTIVQQAFNWDCHYYDGDGDLVCCYSAKVTFNNSPALSYTPETGELKVTMGIMRAESRDNKRIPSGSKTITPRVFLLRWA